MAVEEHVGEQRKVMRLATCARYAHSSRATVTLDL